MPVKHQGTCLCGSVLYELQGSFQSFFLCYCQRCQKGTGSVHAANLFAHSAHLIWIRGADNVRTYRHPGSRHARSFCQHCGSALPTVDDALDCVVVPAGSLDTPVPIAPTARIFAASAAPWSENPSPIPCHAALPDPSGQDS